MTATSKIETKVDCEVLNEKDHAYELALNRDGSLTKQQIKTVKRLEFSRQTKLLLAQRVGYRCSCPYCTNITIGPGDKPDDVVILGEAAHIIGAVNSSDGLSPRTDTSKTDEEIKSLDNGIWLCRHHHRLVDCKTATFTVEELKRWKKQAEEKQAELLLKQETDFVEEYIFPQIDVEKGINTRDFRASEWCLLAYMIEAYGNRRLCISFESDHEGKNFESAYKYWMSDNSIDSKVAKINFRQSSKDVLADIYAIVNKLAGLVKINHYGLDHGKVFEQFCDKLFVDERALEKIKAKLSKV